MINIQNLQFYYENKQVLYDINLQLKNNTITGLIGPNGAGKSTLMRCISGLEIPQQGSIFLDKQPILDNPRQSYTKIGYLPDIFGLSENLTVLQSWTYAASARGIQDAQLKNALISTAKILNLTDKLNDKVANLSRGQKQRVGIGQVIIHRPKLLILDEPASGLDPEARYELSQLFKQLRAEGMTLLISSHILSELDEYCTHMLVIQEGQIKQHKALESYEQVMHQDLTMDATIPIVLRFSEISPESKILIEQAPHIQNLQFNQLQVTATISSQAQCRVELIRYLVQQHLPLIGLEPLKESLLQSYRNSLFQGEK